MFNRITKLLAGTAATVAITVSSFCAPALAGTKDDLHLRLNSPEKVQTAVYSEDKEQDFKEKSKDNGHLKFNSDGKFKIVQFTDIQDNQNTNLKTLQLMEQVLDQEKPNLVVITGDNVTGKCKTADDVRKAIDNFAQPMEKRGINWAITYGNHDEDHTWQTGLDEKDQLKIYMSYEHNVNQPGAKNITGTGNMNLPIRDSKNTKDAFNIWLLDSGRYAPNEIAGQDFSGYPDWDWVRFDQVKWYYDTSLKLEKQNGDKVPSLMFMHIPLWEHRFMWYDSVDGRSDANHAAAVAKHGITGERNEEECPGPFNSGIFAAMLERGDVKGVFVGHDHVNDYVGNYFGIELGYSANTGFATYGLGGKENNRLRGARIFNLDENTNGVFETNMDFAKDYGIQ